MLCDHEKGKKWNKTRSLFICHNCDFVFKKPTKVMNDIISDLERAKYRLSRANQHGMLTSNEKNALEYIEDALRDLT